MSNTEYLESLINESAKISNIEIIKPGDWIHRTWKTDGDIDIFQIQDLTDDGKTIIYSPNLYYRNGILIPDYNDYYVFGYNEDKIRTIDRKATLDEVKKVTGSK